MERIDLAAQRAFWSRNTPLGETTSLEVLALVDAVRMARAAEADIGASVLVNAGGGYVLLRDWLDERFDFAEQVPS